MTQIVVDKFRPSLPNLTVFPSLFDEAACFEQTDRKLVSKTNSNHFFAVLLVGPEFGGEVCMEKLELL